MQRHSYSIAWQICKKILNSTDEPEESRTMESDTRPPAPKNYVKRSPTWLKSFQAILFASWLNPMLIFIPLSWVMHFTLPQSFSGRDILIFVSSFLAIIPLAKLLAFATDELSIRVGQTLAGLLNATLGNMVELIVAIIALTKCELRIVQSSLIGSILNNLLLVIGSCFFAGGMKYSEQGFGTDVIQSNLSLLTACVIVVLLPAAFYLSFEGGDKAGSEGAAILSVSRGVAIILLVAYGGYLFFQLYSQKSLYQDEGEDVIKSTNYGRRKSSTNGTLDKSHHDWLPQQHEGTDEEEAESPQLNIWLTVGLLCIVTVLVAVTAEWLVDSLTGLTESGKIQKGFAGIILLPIVGNAAEFITAVTVSIKDRLQLSLGVAVGSSIQIVLFIIPFITILAWILGKPLTLSFDPYQSITLFLAVLSVSYLVQNRKSSWLEGLILMCSYMILAIIFWFYPGSDSSGLLDTCT